MPDRRSLLLGICVLIAGLDLAQPLLLSWVPKHLGAVMGGLLYLGAAAGIRASWWPASLVVALLPVVPVTVLTLWSAGLPLPVEPDRPMVGIAVLQLIASGLAAPIVGRDRRAHPNPAHDRGGSPRAEEPTDRG